MNAKLIKTRFLESVNRTPTVESFRFVPEEKIDFIPGQFLQVMFDVDNAGNKELNKYLSFSCAPGKDYIEVTKRISESNFSKKLTGLNINDSVLIKAPMGNCVFKEEYKRITAIARYIGNRFKGLFQGPNERADRNIRHGYIAHARRSSEQRTKERIAVAHATAQPLSQVSALSVMDYYLTLEYLNENGERKIKD